MTYRSLALLLGIALKSPLAIATPACVSDTLANYIELVGGCQLGDLLRGQTPAAKVFTDFTFSSNTGLLSANNVNVGPSFGSLWATLVFNFGSGADFTGFTVSAPQTAEVVIGYTASALINPISGVTLQGSGPTNGNGAVVITKQQCLDGVFAGSVCSSGNVAGQAVVIPGLRRTPATVNFTPAFQVGFREVIQLIGGNSGAGDSATIVGVSNQLHEADFSQIPEPATYSLLGAGLVALGIVARRKRHI